MVSTDWNFSQNIRNNVNETLSGVRGDNTVKIIGPDLDELEQTADRVVRALQKLPGLANVSAIRVLGQSNLNFPVDRNKCAKWNLNVSDVQAVVDTAVGGKALSQMIEGERSFDITLRYPAALRSNLDAILDIPVEVSKNAVVNSQSNGQGTTPVSGPTNGASPTGSSAALPPLTGSSSNPPMNDLSRLPRRRLRDLVTPLGPDGRLDEHGSFLQRGASDIFREQGERLIVVKFDIQNVDLAAAVAEAKKATKDLVHAPCRLEWAGEFQAMQQAEYRLCIVIPLTIALVAVLLYMAFGSFIDVLIVLSNVVALACGGVWALRLHADQLQRFRRGGVHIHFWRSGDGCHLAGVFIPPRTMGRQTSGGGGRLRLAAPLAAHHDDRADRDLRTAAGRAFHAHRRPEPASVGYRGNRRHDYGAALEPLPDARPLQRLPPPAAQRRSCRLGRCRVIDPISSSRELFAHSPRITRHKLRQPALARRAVRLFAE